MFNWTTPVQIFGSTFQAMAYSSLPAAAAAANEIYAITDFGNPYVLMQSNGSIWKQVTEFNCPFASLPPATTFAGFIGYTTILNIGTFHIESRQNASSVYKWRPVIPIRILSLADNTGLTVGTGVTAETSIITGPVLPADFLQVKDILNLALCGIRGGSPYSGGAQVRLRMGTSDTPTLNSTPIHSQMAGTSTVSRNSNFSAIIMADTKSRAPSIYNASGTTDNPGSLQLATLESISANAQKLFVTLQPGQNTESITLYGAILTLIPGV